MPRRITPLITDEYYHVFNRSLNRQPILKRKRDLEFFETALFYYTQAIPPVKFSYYRLNPQKYQIDFTNRLVSIICYCLMPNHFHICLKQEKDKGVQLYLQRLQSSFSHYYHTKNDLVGPLFQSTFRNVHIEVQEQLVHLSRYIHLNPVTSYLVEDPGQYEYSSYQIYMGYKHVKCVDTRPVLGEFSSVAKYQEYILDQKGYQRKLAEIKHLLID